MFNSVFTTWTLVNQIYTLLTTLGTHRWVQLILYHCIRKGVLTCASLIAIEGCTVISLRKTLGVSFSLVNYRLISLSPAPPVALSASGSTAPHNLLKLAFYTLNIRARTPNTALSCFSASDASTMTSGWVEKLVAMHLPKLLSAVNHPITTDATCLFVVRASYIPVAFQGPILCDLLA